MADYRKMWEDLGMDVENHDLLCSVLPGAIGDVFLSQENRPEAMDYFDMVLADVHGHVQLSSLSLRRTAVRCSEHSAHMFLTKSSLQVTV